MHRPLALQRPLGVGLQWPAALARPFVLCPRHLSSTHSQLRFHYGLLHRTRDTAPPAWNGISSIGELLLFKGDRPSSPEGQGNTNAAGAPKAAKVALPADLENVSSSSPVAIVGASAKQLFQTAAHSLDLFEPREAGSLEDSDAFDSLDHDGRGEAGALSAAYASKANYEVLRLDEQGKVRRLNVRRRDLLREHGLQPRDLRRIDPSIDFTKTSPSITIKENALLLNFGGIRAIVTAERALVFEPNSANTRKLLDTIVPRLQAAAGQRMMQRQAQQKAAEQYGQPDYRREAFPSRQTGAPAPPFELEVLEAVLMVATGRLDAEVLSVTRRVSALLTQLPRNINPVNLEELRRIKQALVELENKADTVRELLEQIMDDEDEVRELNLSSRPRREERRKQRERERLERELERAREAREEIQERRNSQEGSETSSSQPAPSAAAAQARPPSSSTTRTGSSNSSSNSSSSNGASSTTGSSGGVSSRPGSSIGSSAATRSSSGGSASSSASSSTPANPYAAKDPASVRKERLAELKAKYGKRDRNGELHVQYGSQDGDAESREGRERQNSSSRLDDPEEDYQEAQDALEEMAEQEEEEQELEEVEDLLEYYLQRATATQSEAERLLEGARDLEESIGVSLSARRYEVGRLELMLSMGSFAAALGAMIAGIFGMNLRSTLENSVVGFWGTTAGIIVLCVLVFVSIMRYTQKRRIL